MLKIVTVRFKRQHNDYPRCYRMICSSCVLKASQYMVVCCLHPGVLLLQQLTAPHPSLHLPKPAKTSISSTWESSATQHTSPLELKASEDARA